MHTFLKPNDLLVGDTLVVGKWIVACIDPNFDWSIRVEKISFRGRELFLLPYTEDPERNFKTYPSIALRLIDKESYEAGQIILFEFLSSLAWVKHRGVDVVHWSGGNLPRPMGGAKHTPIISDSFYEPYLPDPRDANTRLALAFYREGLTLRHVAYQCLSFFKVLNIFLRKGEDQIKWINEVAGAIVSYKTKDRLEALKAEKSIGDYLYGSNRCAVAHAGGEPTANPEDPVDLLRLRQDLPVAQALAEYAIEHQFGVMPPSRIYREHLYELDGFKRLFGEKLTNAIRGGASLQPTDFPSIPALSFKLIDKGGYDSLIGMASTVDGIGEGTVRLSCRNNTGSIVMIFALDFSEERLQLIDRKAADLKSHEGVQSAIDLLRFERDLLMNGILEVWDEQNKVLMGRKDAFLPVNMDMEGTRENYDNQIAALQGLLIRLGP